MSKVTNNWGRTIQCVVCNSEDIAKYHVHTPPFASAMDSVYIGGCAEHIKEAEHEHLKATSQRLNLLQAGSNS